MTWNAEKLKSIINDRTNEAEAKDVLMQVTELKTEKEDKETHYFKVILVNVTLDELLDVESVREYLSMVAPVDISSKFIFRNKINEASESNIYIIKNKTGGKEISDEIKDVEFFVNKDEDGNIIYWGWYSLSKLLGQMKPINIARGIRLRKENIQIGDEEICKKFFKASGDQRFSYYFFGEIHAVSKDLIPNSRRDYFGENKACTSFERSIEQQFSQLKDLCYQALDLRTCQKTIAKKEEVQEKIRSKEKNGYTSDEEKNKLNSELENLKIKAAKEERKRKNIINNLNDSNSPLMKVFNDIKTETPTSLPQQSFSSNLNPSSSLPPKKTIYRTDAPKYSSYTKQERKLIGKIYASIENAIPDEKKREALISKIEEDLTR